MIRMHNNLNMCQFFCINFTFTWCPKKIELVQFLSENCPNRRFFSHPTDFALISFIHEVSQYTFFSYIFDQPPKMLSENVFFASKSIQKLFPENQRFTLTRKKKILCVFLGWSIKCGKKVHVHHATSCKIAALMEENCGNERQILCCVKTDCSSLLIFFWDTL